MNLDLFKLNIIWVWFEFNFGHNYIVIKQLIGLILMY